jgi:integrase
MANRRNKGEGSITKRANGLWQYSAEVPSSSGGRARRYFYGKSRTEVLRKVADETARGGGSLERLAVGTVSEWVELWLNDIIKPNRTPNTLSVYTTMWAHAKPFVGSLKLKDFDVRAVESLVTELRKTTKPSIPAKVANVLKSAFSIAIKRKQYRYANPFSVVEVRAPRPKEGRALSVVEAKDFLKAAKGTPYEALWVLLLSSGLRLSEALALEWRDIDLESGSVSVKKALLEVNGICEVAETKTKGSNRRVELGSLALKALKARHRPKAAGFVFTTATGGHPRRSNLRQREFNPICQAAGIEGLTIHGLRHSATSLALAAGVPVVAVAGMLGHGSSRLVQERYGHALPSAHRDASLAVDRMLREPRKRR